MEFAKAPVPPFTFAVPEILSGAAVAGPDAVSVSPSLNVNVKPTVSIDLPPPPDMFTVAAPKGVMLPEPFSEKEFALPLPDPLKESETAVGVWAFAIPTEAQL